MNKKIELEGKLIRKDDEIINETLILISDGNEVKDLTEILQSLCWNDSENSEKETTHVTKHRYKITIERLEK